MVKGVQQQIILTCSRCADMCRPEHWCAINIAVHVPKLEWHSGFHESRWWILLQETCYWCCLSQNPLCVVSRGNYEGREVAALNRTGSHKNDVNPARNPVWLIKQIMFNADWNWVVGQKAFGSGSFPVQFFLHLFPFSGLECSFARLVMSCQGFRQGLSHCASLLQDLFTKSQNDCDILPIRSF